MTFVFKFKFNSLCIFQNKKNRSFFVLFLKEKKKYYTLFVYQFSHALAINSLMLSISICLDYSPKLHNLKIFHNAHIYWCSNYFILGMEPHHLTPGKNVKISPTHLNQKSDPWRKMSTKNPSSQIVLPNEPEKLLNLETSVAISPEFL